MSNENRFALAALLLAAACGGDSATTDAVHSRGGGDAVQALPVEATVERAVGASAASSLLAVELDLIEDDVITRPGVVVLLGREDGELVGLTTRFAADLRYPDPKLIPDGFGAAEFGPQTLEVAGELFAIVPAQTEALQPGQVRRVVFDDHDLALLHFRDDTALAGIETLGVDEPAARVEQLIAGASHVFGLQMTLVSPESMSAMRGAIRVDSPGQRLLVLAITAALAPAVGATLGATEAIDPRLIERIQAALARYLAQHADEIAGPLLDRLEARALAQ